MDEALKLSALTALVTEGSKGTGLEIALFLAEVGADVAVTCMPDAHQGQDHEDGSHCLGKGANGCRQVSADRGVCGGIAQDDLRKILKRVLRVRETAQKAPFEPLFVALSSRHHLCHWGSMASLSGAP